MTKNKQHLVIGIVSPLGTPNKKAFTEAVELFLEQNKKSLGLYFETIKLTKQEYFQRFSDTKTARRVEEEIDAVRRADLKIKAGDEWRRTSEKNNICVTNILDGYIAENKITIIDQLKHKAEWDYIINRFGEKNTLLIGLHSSERIRRATLKKEAFDKSADNMALLERLLIIDQYGYKEVKGSIEQNYSQQVGKFFQDAHVFINMDTSVECVQRQTHRILELLFGNNTDHSPTRDEYCMALAAVACYRSAELGRQVGAVIATKDGDILSAATNDVAHFGGNVYFDTPEGPPCEDNREKAGEQDYGKAKLKSFKTILGDCYEKLDKPKQEWLDNLIEFVRATHAEEQAIINASKLG